MGVPPGRYSRCGGRKKGGESWPFEEGEISYPPVRVPLFMLLETHLNRLLKSSRHCLLQNLYLFHFDYALCSISRMTTERSIIYLKKVCVTFDHNLIHKLYFNWNCHSDAMNLLAILSGSLDQTTFLRIFVSKVDVALDLDICTPWSMLQIHAKSLLIHIVLRIAQRYIYLAFIWLAV